MNYIVTKIQTVVQIDFLLGGTIFGACEEARAFAMKHNVTVNFMFNGVLLIAHAERSVDDMLTFYHTEIKKIAQKTGW